MMEKIKKHIILQLVVLIYAASVIPSKLASNEPFLSFKFCLYYGLIILLLGIYAILWQQVLKKFPLTIAYASKATSIIWCLLIGYFVFNEKITFFNVVGSLLVIIGIIIMVKGGENNE